jgi:hypothetical protein
VSLRSQRSHALRVIAKQLEQARDSAKTMTRTIDALEFAEEALNEEPRSLIKTSFELEYIQVSLMCERGRCGECGVSSTGYEESKWRYCPGCGSELVNFTREDNPHDRLARDAVSSAMASISR